MSRCKRRSVDNSRIFNAFALTARKDNAQLHPGCRCALPWAMFFCAYSACWSMYFLRKSSQSKSGTVLFWVHQTGHPNWLLINCWLIADNCCCIKNKWVSNIISLWTAIVSNRTAILKKIIWLLIDCWLIADLRYFACDNSLCIRVLFKPQS